ncbi:MAG: DUF2007 domain-containing protein [Blastocatellia bacterium]
MAFCPDCEAEYRAGITQCADCGGVALVDKLTPDNRVHDKSEAELVRLRSFATSAEAEMVLDVLQRNGVRAFVEGAGFAVIPGNFSQEVAVMVDERDLVHAVELYEAYFESEPAPSTKEQE